MFDYAENKNKLNGWLNIYKEKGYTSNEIIRLVKKNFL